MLFYKIEMDAVSAILNVSPTNIKLGSKFCLSCSINLSNGNAFSFEFLSSLSIFWSQALTMTTPVTIQL